MEKYTRKKNQFNPMSKEEFMKKEIERQREIEGDKKFEKFRVVTYEQKKSGGYPFSDFQTDNFYEAVLFGKQRMQEQKNYRPDSEYLWVNISEFQPIHERSNVIYPYKSMVHFGEDDIMDSKFAKGGGVGNGYVKSYYNESISGGDNGYQVNLMFYKNLDDEDYFDEEYITTSSPKKAEELSETINKLGYEGFLPMNKYATGGGVGAYYIVTFGFNGDEGYQVVNSKPIFAKSENEAELLLKEQFESYEGVSCDIISTKKQFAKGGGVGLIGNQKRIDMNHNGKIDAEDFEIMRNTMDGAWRKERKYVNSTSRKDGKVIDYEVRYARKNNPSRKGYNGKTFSTGGFLKMLDGKLYERVKFSNGIEDWYEADLLHKVNFYCSQNGLNPNNQKDFEKALENVSKRSFATGGGVSKFEKLSNRVARNYEGKRVKPQYQKEYGKVYSKSEAKEVGDKVAGKVKANQKMATGGATKKGGQGAIMILAKKIRKDGEKWTDAVKRAGQQLK